MYNKTETIEINNIIAIKHFLYFSVMIPALINKSCG